jgi:hypothetical protein
LVEDDQLADGFFDLSVVLAELGQAFLEFDTGFAGPQNGPFEGAVHLSHGGKL